MEGTFLREISKNELVRLDELFKREGEIVPVPSYELRKIALNDLLYYCWLNGIYGVITEELISFLRIIVGERPTIEIGAGLGTLGRALGVPLTDNYLQRDNPEVVEVYQAANQPTINYPSDVEKLDAIAAVEKYQPRLVIGSFVTHQYKEKEWRRGGNMYGVDMIKLMEQPSVEQFIMLGNISTHHNNPLFDWGGCDCSDCFSPLLMTRANDQSLNRIFVFNKKNRIL